MARRNKEIVEVVNSDLRALLFWAAIGMRNSRGGMYEADLQDIIENYAEHIGFKFDKDNRPKWGASLTRRAVPIDDVNEVR